jgi:hypothetical protein
VGKLRVVVTHFLSLCAVLLALPDITAAQPTPLAVQNVWTRDAGGTDKITFASGEAIQFAAQLNNSYGGTLLSAELTITTSFCNNSRTVDIPPGISTWTWNATAPEHGNYTLTVKAYDSFHRAWAMRSTSFTGQSPPPQGLTIILGNDK